MIFLERIWSDPMGGVRTGRPYYRPASLRVVGDSRRSDWDMQVGLRLSGPRTRQRYEYLLGRQLGTLEASRRHLREGTIVDASIIEAR